MKFISPDRNKPLKSIPVINCNAPGCFIGSSQACTSYMHKNVHFMVDACLKMHYLVHISTGRFLAMTKFTEVELEVMNILWEHGELKPAEVIEHYPRPIQNSAVRSFLAVLLKKGHVTRRKVGKAYYYKAKTPREQSFS